MSRALTRAPGKRKPRFFKSFYGRPQKSVPAEPSCDRQPSSGVVSSGRKGGETMHVDVIAIQPLLALLFGILILILPRLLNYLIAVYLIFFGLVGLFPHLFNTTAV
jgi:hypothetical protein